MTRDIKFRAWDGVGMNKPFTLGHPWAGDMFDSNDIIMQYTGLKDKNGKEIYEGDILRPVGIEHMGVGGKFDVEVIFKHGTFGWESLTNGFIPAGAITVDDVRMTERTEVIGNVYENPELLEGSG
jgi:uncharacterized phage protein (TIGR01671 family)